MYMGWVDLDLGCCTALLGQQVATVAAHQPGELPKSILGSYYNIKILKCCIHLTLQKKIEHIHECVVNGDLEELQSALTRRKMALSRDDQERMDSKTYQIHGCTRAVE